MLRFTYFIAASCLVLVSQVSAQQSETACTSLPFSRSAAAGQTFLGLKACFNCHSNGIPNDGFGDQFGITPGDSWILANEVRTWGGKDRHSQAYTSLLSDTGKRIGRAMGIGENAHRDKRCLSCHTAFPISALETQTGDPHGLIREDLYDEDIRLTTGVSCEGCHGHAGGADGWLSVHTGKESWRFLTAENKCEKGFTDVRSVITRTELCLSCHLGNATAGRILTHEMYAAGHPPLPPFEIETFEEQMPAHWRDLSEKAELKQEYFDRTGQKSADSRFFRTKSVLVGALISRSESFRLTADLAAAAVSEVIPTPRWPEFAQFDCYACHHDLKSDNWRKTAQQPGSPGRPVLLPWPGALARLAMYQGEAAEDSDTELVAVRSSVRISPFGEKTRLIEHARAAAESSRRMAVLLNGKPMTGDAALTFLKDLVATAAEETFDYDSARQLLWAFTVVQQELRMQAENPETIPLIHEELSAVKPMFVLHLKQGIETTHRIPGAKVSRSVQEVDLKTNLPPVADYDAFVFRDAFAELCQKHQITRRPSHQRSRF